VSTRTTSFWLLHAQSKSNNAIKLNLDAIAIRGFAVCQTPRSQLLTTLLATTLITDVYPVWACVCTILPNKLVKWKA
jgi:hypothetical protein